MSTTTNPMLNKDVCLTGTNLLLVPYLSHHVARYHDWLSREDILEATCSEQQTLEEEYENQVSWMEADDKMTFIILAPLSVAVPDVEERRKLVEEVCEGKDIFGNKAAVVVTTSAGDGSASSAPTPKSILVSSSSSAEDSTNNNNTKYNPFVMLGDCNLFKMPIHHTEEGEIEVSVMLAENRFRGKGLAREAVALLMSYAYDTLHRSSFVAKILASNEGSRNLFGKGSLGFDILKEVKAFDEIHYIKRIEPLMDPETGALLETAPSSTTAAAAAAADVTDAAITTEEAKGKKSTIVTIDDLKASVNYAKHAYATESCEAGRVVALTDASEATFYAATA